MCDTWNFLDTTTICCILHAVVFRMIALDDQGFLFAQFFYALSAPLLFSRLLILSQLLDRGLSWENCYWWDFFARKQIPECAQENVCLVYKEIVSEYGAVVVIGGGMPRARCDLLLHRQFDFFCVILPGLLSASFHIQFLGVAGKPLSTFVSSMSGEVQRLRRRGYAAHKTMRSSLV